MTESTRNITIMTAEYGTFDHGRLEDYISGRAACDFSVEAEDEEGLWIFLCQIFPDPEVRKYALTVLGSCLDGDISDQNIYFWRGGRQQREDYAIEASRVDLRENCRHVGHAYVCRRASRGRGTKS